MENEYLDKVLLKTRKSMFSNGTPQRLYRMWFHLWQSISNENKSEQERERVLCGISKIFQPNELTMTQNSERPLKN